MELFLNFSIWGWYPGPRLGRRGRLCMLAYWVVTQDQWAGSALEKRSPGFSERRRSLNPVSAVLQFMSIYLIQKVLSSAGLCDWLQRTSHKHTCTTHTLQFCDISSVKAFLLLLLNTSIWSSVSLFLAGSDWPWSCTLVAEPEEESCFLRKLPHTRCAACLVPGVIECRGSFLWGCLSR